MTDIHICRGIIEDCKNIEESYGMICVHCNKCGRFLATPDAVGKGAEEE